MEIRRYSEKEYNAWNSFNESSKNSLFMFNRKYMDYHKDRFVDHSFMFYENEQLIAILPLSERDDILISHGGLTYGGFITDERMKQHKLNECFGLLLQRAKEEGFSRIVYKCIPHVYHKQPAEEDRYALFANGGRLTTVDVSTVVDLKNPLKMPKGRKAQISRAKREGVQIKELCSREAFDSFIDLENEVLNERHGVKAVHTGEELKLLKDKLPENIHLFAAIKDEEIIAGTVLYEYENAIHTQYMAANVEAREIGALDLTIKTVMDKYSETKQWLDFGISTEHGRVYLNEGLCAQKESFGGRTEVYEIWEINLGAHA